MIILRTKTDDGVRTFQFVESSREAELTCANKAAYYIMKTTAAGFIAETDSVDAARGKILQKWDHACILFGTEYRRKLSYSIKYGNYSDTVWAVIGTEKECIRMAEETNAKCTCWASTTCHVEHLCGPLWQCVYTDPYKD